MAYQSTISRASSKEDIAAWDRLMAQQFEIYRAADDESVIEGQWEDVTEQKFLPPKKDN